MAVDLNSIPTTNTLDLTISLLNKGSRVARLAAGEAGTMSVRFDTIGVGSSPPLSEYTLETPGHYTISLGNLAFIDRSVLRKLALRCGRPGGTQQNIVFILEERSDLSARDHGPPKMRVHSRRQSAVRGMRKK